MSAWGAKIYENDLALDVREDIQSLLSVGKNLEQVMEYLDADFPTPGDEEECAFWTSLAYTLWKYGLLPDWVRDKTIDVIKNNNDIELFLSAHDQQERILRLKELETILLSENPKPTKIKKCFVYRTEFAKGDVLALPIDGQILYIHVVDVIRINEKISELSSDEVYVKIFDILTQNGSVANNSQLNNKS